MRSILSLGCAALALATSAYAQKRPFDVETLLRVQRIGDPVISPDGKTVAFTVQSIDLDKNARPKQIYAVPVDGGGTPRQLTRDGTLNEDPRWSPDSQNIYFTSDRGGLSQIWAMSAGGFNARQITRLSTEASGPLLSPDGQKIVFLSSVYPDCKLGHDNFDDACNKRNIDADAKSLLKARVYDSLLYRHWNEWQGKRHQHLMVANIDGNGVRDLTPGAIDVPPFSLGGPRGYAISPDSIELAYVTNTDANLATSTNSDIYVVPLAGGDSKK